MIRFVYELSLSSVIFIVTFGFVKDLIWHHFFVYDLSFVIFIILSTQLAHFYFILLFGSFKSDISCQVVIM